MFRDWILRATVSFPIASFEELVEEMLIAAEHPQDLDRIERVLAGAVRLAGDMPGDAAELIAPLKSPMKRFAERRHWGADFKTPRFALHDVCLAWAGTRPENVAVEADDPTAVIALRNQSIIEAILSGEERIQYSAPTHAGCWIDPVTVVERSLAAVDANAPKSLGLADQCLALLRLAPDNRRQALTAASGLEGDWGLAVRYALGDDGPLCRTPGLAVAAARSRAPFGVDENVASIPSAAAAGGQRPPSFTSSIVWDPPEDDSDCVRLLISVDEPGAKGVDFGAERIGFRSPGAKRPEGCQSVAYHANRDVERAGHAEHLGPISMY